ncbi:MAG: RidA family protein [Chloroflexi bacterium]|nr:RidA family protein [Chloroflexota bacterium]
MAQKKVINPRSLPQLGLPLSPGIRMGNLVFVSGIVARPDPATGQWEPDIRAQVRSCLENIRTILEEGGTSLGHVVSVTSYLKDRRFFDAYNGVYREFFPADPPARTTVQAELMRPEILVEISCIAAVPPQGA